MLYLQGRQLVAQIAIEEDHFGGGWGGGVGGTLS